MSTPVFYLMIMSKKKDNRKFFEKGNNKWIDRKQLAF